MRKFLTVVAFFAIMALLLCGCNGLPVNQSEADLTYAKIYGEAITLGYEGTLEQFLKLVKGTDGNGISVIKLSDEGYLVVTYTNEEHDFVIGKVKGDKGESGTDGISITNVEISAEGELLVTLSTNIDEPINLGKIVADTYIDNAVNGINGSNGIDGTNGIDGNNGINGTNGINGIDGTNGIDGINGTDGTNGAMGTNGKSAYEIYLQYYPNYTKNEKQWLLDFLKGNLVPKYNVTMHYYTGKANEIIEVMEDDRVAVPTLIDTNRQGYKFVKWNVGDAFGMEYDFDNAVDCDLDLFAEYTICDPVLQDKGIIGPQTIPVESLYKYSLFNGINGITCNATKGNVECNIFFMDNTLLKISSQAFSTSNDILTIDLSEFTDILDNMYIVISYRGESGTLTLNCF